MERRKGDLKQLGGELEDGGCQRLEKASQTTVKGFFQHGVKNNYVE